jgi:ribose transport system ATP-binding protein
MSGTALKLKDITKSFSGVKVLHGINISIEKGDIFGIVGENGAGKSTLMNIIGGVIQQDTGEMEICGKHYSPQTPADAVKAEIAFVHQELNLFGNLTVAENMFIESFPKRRGLIDYKNIKKTAKEKIQEYGLPVTPDMKMDTLSAGIKQMIEITKALMKKPRILIFDEPTTSLSYKEKDKLFETILNLKKCGITIIYISHILEDVFYLCNKISVLRDGKIISTDNTSDLNMDTVILNMVGRKMSQMFPSINKKVSEEVMFETRGITSQNKVFDVSISLHNGEIVGLYGLMGSGRTEFLRAAFGLEKIDSGEILVNSKKLKKSPLESINNNIAFVTEDRHLEGLLLQKTIASNLSMVALKNICNKIGVIDRKKEAEMIHKTIKDLQIKVTEPSSQKAESLSGGNQQKVVFGKWVMNNPSIFLLDEPTRGVDIGAKFEIYSIIAQMATNGATILMVSSEIEELIGICDRILVMKDGRITGEIKKSDFDQETIIRYAL